MKPTSIAVACLSFLLGTGLAQANQDRLPYVPEAAPSTQGGSEAQDFGTNTFYSAIEGSQVQPRTSSTLFERGSSTGAYYCTPGGPSNEAYGQFFVPHGVRFSGMRVWMWDDDAANQVQVTLQSACLPDFSAGQPTVTSHTTVSSGLAFAGGAVSDFNAFTAVTADNQSCTYRIRALVGTPTCGGSISLGIYKARLQWSRFTPPAPASATFLDVPTTDPFFAVIEALAATGVTAGCGGGNFCPNSPITRAGIAAMLVRALGLQPATITDPANP